MIADFAPGLWTPGTPRIPVPLSDIIAMSLQLIKPRERVWLSLDEVNLLSPGKVNRNCRVLTNLGA
jgi:hypothetical protein